MAFFLKYLRQNRKIITLFALFCIIFGIVFALYGLPMQAVVYPTFLCMLLGIICVLVDYARAKRRHAELERLTSLTAAMVGELPDEDTIENEDYQAILRALQAEAVDTASASAAKYRDMIDYYTVWVHQIKTPIASMRLQLQDTDSAEARRLRADLFRIEQYVEMVLAFLRLDSESSDYVFREASLDEMIRNTVKKFSYEFIGRKIALQYETIDLSLVTDEKWLSFVLEQLLSNALKYTPSGCVKIYRKEPHCLVIEDTGIGIAPEDLPRIFEKGYTGYNGRTDKAASGLGLYLCKRICDQLGIRIAVTSKVGQGTAVSLDLQQNTERKE